MGKLCCLTGYQNKVWRLRQSSLFRITLLSNHCRKYHNISQLFGKGKDFSDGFFLTICQLFGIGKDFKDDLFTGVYNLDGCGPD